jgi:hypothetical protein
MKEVYEFDAVIQPHPSMDAAFVEFPFNVETEFGVKGQVKVVALFDGIEYRGSLARMGHHCQLIGLNKAVRKAIGKAPGDTVRVVIRKDAAPRTVEIPDDLQKLFGRNKKAKEIFEALSYSHKKEHVDWLTSAKKQETRLRRLEKLMAALLKR